MPDSFEESLRTLLQTPNPEPDKKRLNKVLKRANRQIGAGYLMDLMSLWPVVLKLAARPFDSGNNRQAKSDNNSSSTQ